MVTLTLKLCSLGAVNVEDKDWVETLIFGSIQGVFKLDNKA